MRTAATSGHSGFPLRLKLFGPLFVLLVTLVVVGSVSVLIPKANAQGYDVTLESRQDNGATVNIGTITFASVTYVLPATAFTMSKTVLITYNPPLGYVFVRWEHSTDVTLSDHNSQSTTATFTWAASSLTAIYTRNSSVGGVVAETNTLAVLTPYLVAIGLVATTAAVAVKKRRN